MNLILSPSGVDASTHAYPMAAPIPRACALSGLSRSAIYRAAAAGQITLRKIGRTTLVDLESVRAFLASLPEAQIGVGTRRA